MFEKNMRIAYLLDFYGDALDEHTAGILSAYYNEDLSLAEIAEGEGISRQGIRHLIKKGEEQLEFFDSKFSLTKRYEELEAAAKSLTEICEGLKATGHTAEAEKISQVIGIILKGN